MPDPPPCGFATEYPWMRFVVRPPAAKRCVGRPIRSLESRESRPANARRGSRRRSRPPLEARRPAEHESCSVPRDGPPAPESPGAVACRPRHGCRRPPEQRIGVPSSAAEPDVGLGLPPGSHCLVARHGAGKPPSQPTWTMSWPPRGFWQKPLRRAPRPCTPCCPRSLAAQAPEAPHR